MLIHANSLATLLFERRTTNVTVAKLADMNRVYSLLPLGTFVLAL